MESLVSVLHVAFPSFPTYTHTHNKKKNKKSAKWESTGWWRVHASVIVRLNLPIKHTNKDTYTQINNQLT
jgi:anti-sigma-K factor RskA